MVTALDQPSDRVAGLDAGADDFPDQAGGRRRTVARVRSLVRLKMMTDELRMRETTGQSKGLLDPTDTLQDANPSGRILILEDRPESVAWFAGALQPTHGSRPSTHSKRALVRVRGGDYDLIIVSARHARFRRSSDLCSQLRSIPRGAARADPGRGQRRRPPQAHPGAGDGRSTIT